MDRKSVIVIKLYEHDVNCKNDLNIISFKTENN